MKGNEGPTKIVIPEVEVAFTFASSLGEQVRSVISSSGGSISCHSFRFLLISFQNRISMKTNYS